MKHTLKIEIPTEKEMIALVKKAEKRGKIPYNEFVKITETWMDRAKKA